MAEKMTPRDAVQYLSAMRLFVTTRERVKQPEGSDLFDEAMATLHAHLAQPAQAVDVGAIREVIAYLKVGHKFDKDMADKLTRAIGNAQADD